jgi:hypothetical protein
MAKPTQRDRVRKWLETHGSMTNVDAVQNHIFRLSERIRELQSEGMKITGEWVKVDGKRTGTFKYTLDGGPKKRFVPQIVIVNGERKVRMVEA